MSTGRETSRDALVTLLTTALVGAGLPVDTVTGSKVTSLKGIWPLVSVLSKGSTRPRMTFQGDRGIFNFSVQVWVLQSKVGSWTLIQAEDALDEIEALIAGVYEANDGTANWEILRYDGPTTVWEVVAGVPYYVERIPTQVLLGRN